jgi:hypothetical protein
MADVVIAPSAPDRLVITGGTGALVLTSGEVAALTVVAPRPDAVAYDDAPATVEIVPTVPSQIEISDHYVPVPGPQGEQGPAGPQGPAGDPVASMSFVYQQPSASEEWVIDHPLAFVPQVSIVDSAGTQVYGDVTIPFPGRIIARFVSAFTGTAYLS